MSETREYTMLVAFGVNGTDPMDAQRRLIERLTPLTNSRDETSPIECWWVAEDDRLDGSDCDSAVFVHGMSQEQAQELLADDGLDDAPNRAAELDYMQHSSSHTGLYEAP